MLKKGLDTKLLIQVGSDMTNLPGAVLDWWTGFQYPKETRIWDESGG